jgi:hypothetical protein
LECPETTLNLSEALADIAESVKILILSGGAHEEKLVQNEEQVREVDSSSFGQVEDPHTIQPTSNAKKPARNGKSERDTSAEPTGRKVSHFCNVAAAVVEGRETAQPSGGQLPHSADEQETARAAYPVSQNTEAAQSSIGGSEPKNSKYLKGVRTCPARLEEARRSQVQLGTGSRPILRKKTRIPMQYRIWDEKSKHISLHILSRC